jgi:hypothetical protein
MAGRSFRAGALGGGSEGAKVVDLVFVACDRRDGDPVWRSHLSGDLERNVDSLDYGSDIGAGVVG